MELSSTIVSLAEPLWTYPNILTPQLVMELSSTVVSLAEPLWTYPNILTPSTRHGTLVYSCLTC